MCSRITGAGAAEAVVAAEALLTAAARLRGPGQPSPVRPERRPLKYTRRKPAEEANFFGFFFSFLAGT